MESPLIWVGGKRWQAPYITPLFDHQRRFVELFCGSLSISLDLEPTQVLANDINPDLINFYQQVQNGFNIDGINFENTESTFYEHRQEFNRSKLDTKRTAQLFYYLNRTCFRGLSRYNSKGEFNAPYGWRGHSVINGRTNHNDFTYQTTFTEYQKIFSNWEFTNVDFRKVTLLPDDFVYADPPYDNVFVGYNETGFTWNDQVECATMLTKHTGPVILTNEATERIIDLYTTLGYALTFFERSNRMRAKKKNVSIGTRQEIMATRNVSIFTDALF